MFVPEPVIKMAINPLSRDGADKLSKALHRFRREDPTFRVTTDEETGETRHRRHGRVAPGHLRRADPPRVQRRGRGRRAEGQLPRGAHQDGRVQLQAQEADRRLGPVRPHRRQARAACPKTAEDVFEFEENVVGGRIPKEYIPAVEKGFRDSLAKGPVAEYPIVGVKAILEDGSYHEVDSSDMAFQICARNCFRETFLKTKPVLLEPVMKVEIEVPTQYPGPGGRRTDQPPRHDRGSTEVKGEFATIEGEVPLAETFGYSTDLRSMTQGQGTFTMEFAKYRRVPSNIQEEIIAEKKKQLVGAK